LEHIVTRTSSVLRTTRILVVDDDSEVPQLIRTQLRKRADLEVVGDAADGFAAIERCRELQPDLVICNITMPRLDGIDAVPGLRDAAPGARILMHSCHEDELTVGRAMNAGAHGYLVKGAVRLVLVAKIDDLMTQLV
jgi:two-component system nitrate/nitrite response regulator NarL